MSGSVQEVNAQEFDQIVASSTVPVVADFWAPWCGPCRMVGPVLEKMASDHVGKVSVVKINVDVNQELAARYGSWRNNSSAPASRKTMSRNSGYRSYGSQDRHRRLAPHGHVPRRWLTSLFVSGRDSRLSESGPGFAHER